VLGAVVVGTVVVVLGASVVVVGAALLVDDDGVAVSDGGALPADVCVYVFAGAPGLAGVVLTLEVGALGALFDECRTAISTPLPIASTASAVPIATSNGRRYQTETRRPS